MLITEEKLKGLKNRRPKTGRLGDNHIAIVGSNFGTVSLQIDFQTDPYQLR
jgi:hypothetical protein